MKFLLRRLRFITPLPEVPKDKEEREVALSTSECELIVLRDREPEIDKIVSTMQVHMDRNHWGEQLERGYNIPRGAR
jgi:hypothetical protein